MQDHSLIGAFEARRGRLQDIRQFSMTLEEVIEKLSEAYCAGIEAVRLQRGILLFMVLYENR